MHGARLQARGLLSGAWLAFRHGACLQARGVPSVMGSHFRHGVCLQVLGASVPFRTLSMESNAAQLLAPHVYGHIRFRNFVLIERERES